MVDMITIVNMLIGFINKFITFYNQFTNQFIQMEPMIIDLGIGFWDLLLR
jgi:hypothetical protein